MVQASAVASLPANSAWDEAFLRVESYLRSHQLTSRVQLNRLATEILAAAQVLSKSNPEEPPVTLAIRVAQARIGDWMVRTVGQGDWADERFRARGRLALVMGGIPQNCPERFLSEERLPAELEERIHAAELVPGPELRLTSMPPAPLEFPIGDVVEEKWVTFNRSAFFRSAASWLIIAAFASIAWLVTR